MPNFLVKSDATTQFTGALGQWEAEEEAIPGLRADGTMCVSNISIRSKQQLPWRVEQRDPDNNIIASHQFALDDAMAKLGADLTTMYYHYSYTPSEEWDVPFSKSYTSTFAVRNTATEPKAAGTDGELILYLKICTE